MEHIGTNKVK